MERRAIKLAENTLVVSLPAKWCREQRIRKGSALSVVARGTALQVAAVETIPQTLILRCPVDAVLAARLVGWAYKTGIDELTLQEVPKTAMPRIKQELAALSGYEIIRERNQTLNIRAVSRLNPQDLRVLESRMWYILLEMVSAHLHGESRELAIFEKDIDALSNACKRIIAKQPMYGAETLNEYALIRELEKMGDVLLAAKASKQILRETQRLLLRLQSIRQTADREAMAQCLTFPWDEHAENTFIISLKDLASPVLALAIARQVQRIDS